MQIHKIDLGGTPRQLLGGVSQKTRPGPGTISTSNENAISQR
jgi:hypothetical protein